MMKTLTSGDIAKYCDVNLRTVIRWINNGHIKSFKLPGRGNNRVKQEDFVAFLKKHGMPIPVEFQNLANKVLVVDDEEFIASVIEKAVKDAGFETQIAYDGFQAGKAISSFMPALITLDLNMPGLDGLGVIKYVRSDPDLASIKILVVSALSEEKLNEALEAGADAAMTKPFVSAKLIEKIHQLLELEAA
jgi:two-component system response regulator VicR